MTSPLPARVSRPRPSRLVMIAGVVTLVAIMAAAAWLLWPKAEAEPYRTGPVERGEIVRSVSASGTLQALVTVQVGSQLSGQVTDVLVDFNTPVKRGQLLAVVDPSTFQSRAAQTAADLAAQRATLQQQQAGLAQAQAEVDLQKVTYERSKALTEKGFLAQSALDQAEAAYKKAEAALGVSRAQISAQQARIGQSRAALNANELDVSRTRIVSPIDGVVVSRAVDPGQTVAASLQVSTLFQIAQDLSKLQVKILVDEADIGQVREGQNVTFSVDAFPDETFTGVVTQVRKQPETAANVVAYSVIAEADNRGGRLLPGMTANANIVIEQKRNVLKAPSAALRWRPADQAAPAGRQGQGGAGAQARRGGQGQGQAGGFGARAEERLFETLKLDAGQKTRAEAIFAATRRKAQAAAADAADPQARRKATQAANTEAYEQLAPLLKPDQRARLAAFRAQAAERGGRGGDAGAGFTQGTVWVLEDGKPMPVFVRVGATDGAFAEVRGDVKEGQAVLIGGGPRPKATLPGAPGGGGMPGAGGPGAGALRRIG